MILISNDDGVMARGIRVLERSLAGIDKTLVVAPLEEKSTTGHSLTLHKPLRLKHFEDNIYAINGGPADCVQMGVGEVLKGKKPELFVSGINRGANLAQDVYYSGTVSAAREAAIMGIPSIAISTMTFGLRRIPDDEVHYETAGKVLVDILHKTKFENLKKGTVININVPNLAYEDIKGVKLSSQGTRNYSVDLDKRVDHRAQSYFWVGGKYLGFESVEGTDVTNIDQGWVSVTPLQLDCTDYKLMDEFNDILSINYPLTIES